MKFLKILARWIFILSIPVFCLSFTVDREFSTAWFYTYGFEKYGISDTTGLSQEQLVQIADKFVEYFSSSEEQIRIFVDDWGSLPLFNEQETIHFTDVKNLVLLDRRIMLGSLGVILLGIIWWQRRDWPGLGRSLIAGGILTGILLFMLLIGVNLNFDWLFLQFHLLSFTNNFWYSRGYMTLLFPQGFWFDMAFFTILITTSVAIVFTAAGYALVRFIRPKEK